MAGAIIPIHTTSRPQCNINLADSPSDSNAASAKTLGTSASQCYYYARLEEASKLQRFLSWWKIGLAGKSIADHLFINGVIK
jgi:hypothetical protein